ncbi:CDP-diacylglycerol--glycerol-3-phosphate 3-phosphatidyltransferase [Nocardioides mangrovicus]|uniref:CDP-diacylglycerol--glycerol-3-phosphate 3-phosphatidyltransferase n=1 Tax=Nocardioides mangrovicus TaxID=2478913 RepID=A0A3L8P1U8_9ACTN|nr:CDP-diacylglycerol--glycerol-3-phosphate 3-phosphatidyltransferase [Nocardioides mangrovicus]RLV48922.1 CDP-diacylglycerol--glycerol-3-phosphate 3-phosphatidyltransferase [Nocardioides mangrovicus]
MNENVNVPNALTTLRIVMVPFFGWALLVHDGHSTGWRWVAWVLFGLAMITDKIDGDLARKHDLITDFGKIADPIADKALTGMAFIGLSIIGALWWWVTIIVLVREWAVTFARLSIAKHVVIPAKQSGKYKTFLQAIALGGFVGPFRPDGFFPDFSVLSSAWDYVGAAIWLLCAVAMAGAFVLTLTSGYDFARDAIKQTRQARAAKA